MKKKNLTVRSASPTLWDALKKWLDSENKMLSDILEESISNAVLLRMCNCAVAFCVMAIAANFNVVTMIVGLTWWITTIADLKNHIKK